MSIRQAYAASLKKVPSEEVLDLIFYRPLGFLFAYSLKKTFVSPNMITIFSLILGTATGFVAYFVSLEAGALILLLVNILDCADGQLARLKKQFSDIGKFLDGFADYFTFTSFYFGIGFALIRDSNNFSYFWIGLTAGITTIIHSGIFDNFRMRYLGGYSPEDLRLEIEKFKTKMKNSWNWFYKIFCFFTLIYIRNQLSSLKKPNNKITDRFIRLLSFTGPTTAITLMVIFSFLHRIDLYFYTISIGMNCYLIVLFLFRKLLNHEK